MSRPTRSRAMRNLESAANSTGRATEKAAVGLAKWATTDHTGFSKSLDRMPKLGFLDSLSFIFTQFIISMVGAVLAAGLMFLLIAYGVPALISVIFQ